MYNLNNFDIINHNDRAREVNLKLNTLDWNRNIKKLIDETNESIKSEFFLILL